MKTKILVTGGAGYIGSHTTVELQNTEVINGIERITGTRPAFEQIDMQDKEAMRKLFEKHSGIKGVINFAASKAVGESVKKPLLYYRNNLVTMLNLLDLMPLSLIHI